MAQHTDLGNIGEEAAVKYLRNKGYKILERNYRFDKAEIDIVAKHKEVLAIIEVKTRTSIDFGNPQDFVKPKQIQRLVKAVNEYVEKKNLDLEIRFDIIAIVNQKDGLDIEHIENAFYHF